MKNFNKKKLSYLLITIIGFAIIATVFYPRNSFTESTKGQSSIAIENNINKDFTYLSDIPYVKEQSSVGWGNITLDHNLESNQNNGLIALIINGSKKLFLKGIAAHATSTLVYNITGLNYDYFSTYYGLDASKGTNGNGVKFSIYTSVDGVNWDLHTLVSPPVKKGNSEAEFITIDIKGKNYIKLYAHNNGNDTADHAVYADAMLYKEGYNKEEATKPYDFIKTLDEYDNILNKATYEELVTSKEHTILSRKFVSNIGYELLQAYAHLDNNHKETIKWILTDHEALKYYITGGRPTGTYMKSLDVLVSLYSKYKDDLSNKTKTQYTVLGDLYKRMMITLSLTHSADVCLWIGGNQCSNPVTRYEIYKEMQAGTNEFNGGSILNNAVFETLNIEEMRWVMNNNIDDEEIKWLNYFMRVKGGGEARRGPYNYIVYRFGYNYNLAQYYSAENYEKWDKKYFLSKFNITYKVGKPKLWIVFEQGSVCGGLSKTGSNLDGALGIPSAVLGQPGHAAFMEYSKAANGDGMWSLNNDVSGWTKSEKSERLLCGWGSNNWDSYYQVSYVPYAQEALNDLENYNKALETMLLAELYANDVVKLEEIYNKALEYQSFNMDAWYGLIRTYQQNTNKTAEDYIELAARLADKMYYFPLPMYDLLKLINNNLKGTNYYAIYDNYTRIALQKATGLNGDNSFINQPSISRIMANYLLGNNDYSIASFSFSGDNAGKIMLGSKYEGNGVRWDYSLDGGNTWTATSEKEVLLSKTELNSITAQNDIKIHIVGSDYRDENIYTINIIDNVINANNFYRNDLENRIMGIDLTYEWRNSENDDWTSYATSSPNNTGNKTLQIRQMTNGVKLASNILTFEFTEDNQTDTRKYIPVSHLSIVSFSKEYSSNPARYSIDGNYNTYWLNSSNGADDKERYITIMFDKAVYLSAMDYVPTPTNGKIMTGKILGSLNGEDFFEITNVSWANNNDTKTVDFEPVEVKYVKIVGENMSWSNTYKREHMGARMFNFYHDSTQNPHPTAGIGYSTTDPTNKEVVARLINPSTKITITSEGGDTHVFKENGDFTFEFVDEKNTKGSATAKVRWIDKEAPTATIEFNITTPTNKEVMATIKPSEEVIVTNNTNYTLNAEEQVLDKDGNILEGFTIEDEHVIDPNGNIIANCNPLTYEFTKNGEFTFEFQDKAGNKGKATAKVDWIDTVIPEAQIKYDIKSKTNKNVTASITFDKNDVKVTNNNGKTTYVFQKNGEFTFEFKDAAGNIGSVTAKVNWIDKEAPTAELKYDKSSKTKAVVKVVNPSEEISYKEGNGTYEFAENGIYKIVIYDKAGNSKTLKAIIDWLEEKKPDKPVNPDEPSDNDNSDNKPNKPSDDGNNDNKPNKPSDNDNNDNKPNKPSDNDNNDNKPNKPSDNDNNDNKPNKPSDDGNNDNKPNKPSDDDNNDNKPDKPSDAGNNNDNSSKPEKPGDSTNTNNPGTITKPNDSNNGNNNNTTTPGNETKEQTYSAGNITINIPEDAVKDNITLTRNFITINSTLKERFGASSEYFELYFNNENLDKVEPNTIMKLTVELDKTKKFLGIYEITENSLIRTLNYEVENDGSIKFETDHLGKYVISYNEETSESPVTNKPETSETRINNNVIWFVASGAVAAAGLMGLVLKKRKSKK